MRCTESRLGYTPPRENPLNTFDELRGAGRLHMLVTRSTFQPCHENKLLLSSALLSLGIVMSVGALGLVACFALCLLSLLVSVEGPTASLREGRAASADRSRDALLRSSGCITGAVTKAGRRPVFHVCPGGAGGIRTRGGLLTHTRAFQACDFKPLIHRSR